MVEKWVDLLALQMVDLSVDMTVVMSVVSKVYL